MSFDITMTNIALRLDNLEKNPPNLEPAEARKAFNTLQRIALDIIIAYDTLGDHISAENALMTKSVWIQVERLKNRFSAQAPLTVATAKMLNVMKAKL